MKQIKKGLALLLAAVMLLSFTGCNTDWVFDYDGDKIPASVYIGYTLGAYEELYNQPGYDSSITDPFEQTVNGMSAEEWIKQSARENCDIHAVINRKFTELELELEQEKIDEVDEELDATWEQVLDSSGLTMGDFYEDNGVSKDTYRELLLTSARMEAVFEKYYGEDGIAEVPEEELLAHFKENFTGINLIAFSFVQGDDLTEEQQEANDTRNSKLQQYQHQINEEGIPFSDCYDDYYHFLVGSEHKEGDGFGTDEEMMSWVTRGSNSNYSEELTEKIFAQEPDGTAQVIEDGSSRYLVVRYDAANEENFPEMRENVLYDARSDLFTEQVKAWAEEMGPKVNSAAVRRYDPKNIY